MSAETQKGEAEPEKEVQSPKDLNLSTDMFSLLDLLRAAFQTKKWCVVDSQWACVHRI